LIIIPSIFTAEKPRGSCDRGWLGSRSFHIYKLKGLREKVRSCICEEIYFGNEDVMAFPMNNSQLQIVLNEYENDEC
jgi:hypothetical protein